MKASQFFGLYGAAVDVAVTGFTDQLGTAVDNGWLTRGQAKDIIAAAAQQSADTIHNSWTPETPAGFTAENNPYTQGGNSPCAKLMAALANLTGEVPEDITFPPSPQGTGEEARQSV